MTAVTIRKTRERLGLSVEQFAELLEVSVQTVYRWEKGTRSMSSAHSRLLAMLLEKKGEAA